MRLYAVFLPTGSLTPVCTTMHWGGDGTPPFPHFGLEMIGYPTQESNETWPETQTVYGRESAVFHAGPDRVRYRPRKLTMRFALPNGAIRYSNGTLVSAAYRAPVRWEADAKKLRELLDAKRLRFTVISAEGAAYLENETRTAADETTFTTTVARGSAMIPLRYDTIGGRYGNGENCPESGGIPTTYAGYAPLYYEGLIRVGPPSVSDGRAEIEVTAEIDPWVRTASIDKTLTVNAAELSPLAFQRAGLEEPVMPVFSAVTTDPGTEANRLYVREHPAGGSAGPWYPLFLTAGGCYYDSGQKLDTQTQGAAVEQITDADARSIAVTAGDVDWDAEKKRFAVLPIRFPSNGTLYLEFKGVGSVRVFWKVGERA